MVPQQLVWFARALAGVVGTHKRGACPPSVGLTCVIGLCHASGLLA